MRLPNAVAIAATAAALAISSANAVPNSPSTISFGASSARCGGTVLCSRDGTHGYLRNGKGQAFKASTIRKWFQVDVDGKSHLKGQIAEPLRGSGAFVVVNDTGRPISKFALRIATDAKPCATKAGQPCHTFAAQGGSGGFRYSGMLTARDRHTCTRGKTMRDICMGDAVAAAFASANVLYSWTAKPEGAIPPGAYFLIQFSGWTNNAWAAPPTLPSITLISKASDGTPGDNRSYVSQNGQLWTADNGSTLFGSFASNLPGASDGNLTLYIYNVASGGLTPVPTPIPCCIMVVHSMSADGALVGYVSEAASVHDDYVYDVASQTTETISNDGYSNLGYISDDGHYFIYQSDRDVLIRDRIANTTSEMLAPGGSPPDHNGCEALGMDGSAQVVLLGCTAENLVLGVAYPAIYAWDHFANSFEVLTRSTDGAEGIGFTGAANMSSNGRFAIFTCDQTDLVPGGTTGVQVFVYDRTTKATRLVSAASDGTEANSSHQAAKYVTSDGHFAVFISDATNLIDGASGYQAYVKNLQTGELLQVSPGNYPDGVNASISESGQYVVFEDGLQVYLATFQ